MKKSMYRNTSGQMLMIGVLLFFVLLAVIPAIIFMNRTSGHHNIFSQKKSKGRLIAEEGVSLAIQQLSKPNKWPYLGGTFPTPNPATITSAQGGSYVLTYTAAPAAGLQSYQVGIRTSPIDSAGKPIPGSSILTTVSQRTTGIKMPTGQSASAALDLMKVPVVDNTALLRVEFGSIVVRDTATWTLSSFLDTSKRPRKFSAGAIAPRVTNPDGEISSDQREYWAYASPGFAPVIDETSYRTQAGDAASTCPVPANCLVGQGVGASAADCTPATGGRCDFLSVQTSTIVFNAAFSAAPSRVIYINGNAQFDGVTIDVSNGAVIVTGNLILGNNGRPMSTYSPATNVPLPPSLGLEDPRCTCSDPWCIGTVDRHIDFKGFLYVRGDLTTHHPAPTPNGNWTLIGTARVDKTLTLDPGTSLVLFYNDVINHTIKTTNFELQIDSMTAVP